MILDNLIKIGAAAVLALGLSATASSAVTVVTDGGTYATGAGQEDEFIGEINALGGAGVWSVLFESTSPADAVATATIGSIVASTFQDLTLVWLNANDNSVLSSIPITPVMTSLPTEFGLNGNPFDQILLVSWSDSLNGAGFDIELSVTPVPLPFAGTLLLTGIAGFGLVRRRKASA